MNKIAFWFFIFISIYLLAASIKLDYPVGYHGNVFVYGITLFACVFYCPSSYSLIIKSNWRLIKNSCLVAGLFSVIMFFASAGLVIIPIFKAFDFDDKTVFYDGKYRIVITEDIVRSGGQSYFAVLKKKGLKEYCIFRSQGYPSYSNPKIIEKDGQTMLVQDEKFERSIQIIPNE